MLIAPFDRHGVDLISVRLSSIKKTHKLGNPSNIYTFKPFITFQLGNFSEARALSESASRDDPYSCAARVTLALATVAGAGTGADLGADAGTGVNDTAAWQEAARQLAAASHLDPADLIAMHDLGMFISVIFTSDTVSVIIFISVTILDVHCQT